jgi:hypothetical protein
MGFSAWQTVLASGLEKGIDKSFREKMENLYGATLPAYNRAWMLGTERMKEFLRDWDNRFGTRPPSGARVHNFDWWAFLSAEGPDLGFRTMLGPEELIPLREEHIGHVRMRELGITSVQFFEERWQEAQDDHAFIEFRQRKRVSLEQVHQLVDLLQKEIHL